MEAARVEARARLSTLRLFSSTKRGGVLFAGVKNKKKIKKRAGGLDLGGECGVCASVCKGRGPTSLTPHHLLPRLSEDRGRARSVGCRI